MDKSTEFVTKRAAAHKAGTQNIASDHLVQAALHSNDPVPPLHPSVRAMLWNADGRGGFARRQAD